jgi:N-acetyl sugar amidotransferase
MKYCKECLYPSTKPDIWFDKKGLCAACIAFKERDKIDWKERANEFEKLVFAIKQMKFDYDCIVPVSGGKDSHYQIIKAKEYGLKVLAVNATTDSLSSLGQRNLTNISRLGCDVISISVDSRVRNGIAKHALLEIGDISYAEHVTIFTVPIHVAHKLSVPMVLWGENPQAEYGGPAAAQTSRNLNERWLSEFGGLNGLRVSDLIEQGLLPEDSAHFYKYPNGGALKNPTGVFLGYYFPWDGYQNAVEAQKHGFRWSEKPVEGIGYGYENLDNLQTGLRDYLKYVKYGFGRATDLVNNHIRRKRITRAEGISHCATWDGQYPRTYLGVSLEEILGQVNCTIEEYIEVIKRFTNKELFTFGNHTDLPMPKFEIGKGLL